MIIKDNKKIKLYYGNCRPVRVMKNNKLLGGWKKTGMSSGEAEFNNTFNDVITLHGRGANIPAESKSGEVITADNVYEVEHTLNCYLTSDTITDFSGVKVSRYGKNLANIDSAIRTSPSDIFVKNGEGYTFTRYGTYRFSNKVSLNIPANKEVTTTFEIIDNTCTTSNMECLYIQVYYADGTNGTIALYNKDTRVFKKDVIGFNFFIDSSNADGSYVTFKNFQIEIGQEATDYERYIEPQTVTANVDGGTEGLTSLSTSMTIMTSIGGAVINLQYLKSLNSESLTPAPDNIRPVIGAKGTITVTDQNKNSIETQCPELYGVQVAKDAPYNYTETVNGEKKYYITDTLEGKTITRRIGRLELTGAEDGWERYANGNEKIFVLPCNTSLKSSSVKCICNAFTGLTRNEIYIGGMGISCSGGYIRVSQEIDGVFLRDIEVFKAFLAEQYAKGTPVTIYYALKQPVFENVESYPRSLPFYTHIKTETGKGYLNYGMQDCIKVSN